MAYNRWLSQDYLAHHGVKGQKWGERNGPPYPLDSSKSDGHKLLNGDGSPQGKKKYKTSEKTAHKRAERKARTESKGEDTWKVNEWHMPQPWPGENGDDLHKYMYKNNEAYRKNFDEAEPLRNKLLEAVDREIDMEQKIMNGDFGFTRSDGTNPKSLDKAYDEWEKRIEETSNIYSDLHGHYKKVLGDVNNSYKDFERNKNSEAFKERFVLEFDKEFNEDFANSISPFPIKKSFFTGKNVRDKKQYDRQIAFEDFLSNSSKVQPYSDTYQKIVNEQQKVLNQMAKARRSGKYRLANNLVSKQEKLNDELNAETFKMLGLDESKLAPISKIYIYSALREAYRDRYQM